MLTTFENVKRCEVTTRIDTVFNAFAVTVQTEIGNQICSRQYFFNMPADTNTRAAQTFESCVGEALLRHEAWVSGNATSFGADAASSAAASTQTTAEPATPPAASQGPSKKKPGAAAQQAPEVTTPSAGPAKKKAAPAPQPVSVPFGKTEECKKAFSEVVSSKLGKAWAKNEEYKTDAMGIARKLEEEGVICLVDGKPTEEFMERVVKELEALYDFE